MALPTPRNHPDPPRSRAERPFQGWTWRGARLTDRQLALFIPGRLVKHLGIPVLRLGRPTRAPIHFAVYAHQGWRRGARVALPAEARFEVWALLPLPGGGTCVVLEQLDERICAPPAFRRSLDRWLQRFSTDLAPPTAADLREQEQPFARWLPESRAGTPPLEGPIYEFEQAVSYAAAWSGLEEPLVWRVLEAYPHDLERAEVEGDAAAGWPALPNPTGDLIETHIAGATGLDRSAIAAVCRGEMAYLDHLGLVAWDRDGAREERLGSPAWPLAGVARAKRNGI